MEYVAVPYAAHLAETLATLAGPGCFLVTQRQDGYLNAMVIGWGLVGPIWGKPIFAVLVRPSRFTYSLLEEGSAFTVCVPSPAMRAAVDFCGSQSGRSHDKFRELGLEPLPSTQVSVPGIAGCPVIYECQPVHYNDVQPGVLAAAIQESAYRNGDYHRIYYGEILAVRTQQGQG